MTTRTFKVVQTGECYKITLSLASKKRRISTKHNFQGYLSISAAEEDIAPINSHIDAGNYVNTFVKNVGEAPRRKKILRANKTNHDYGCVIKAKRKLKNKKYRVYLKNMKKGLLTPVSRSKWEADYDAVDGRTGQREALATSRDPSTRFLYLSTPLESPLQQEKVKAIELTVKYMKERTVAEYFLKAAEFNF